MSISCGCGECSTTNIKPNLIDRFLATADQNQVEATIVINKCDLIEPGDLQPLVGNYAQIGYRVIMVSAAKGWNIEQLRRYVVGRQSAVVGQSGVGKVFVAQPYGSWLAIEGPSGQQRKSKREAYDHHFRSLSIARWRGDHRHAGDSPISTMGYRAGGVVEPLS